jgi:hypothetical protein
MITAKSAGATGVVVRPNPAAPQIRESNNARIDCAPPLRPDPRCGYPAALSELVVRFEQRTLLIPRFMRHAGTLVREARAFQMKISASGHDTYNARSGEHDDLLLAVAMPVWWHREHGSHQAGVWIL